jgi:hypothetical protein
MDSAEHRVAKTPAELFYRVLYGRAAADSV